MPDEEGTAPVMREVIRRVLDGDRITSIVGDLNRRGVQTTRDRNDVLNGRAPQGRQWKTSNLRPLVTSPTVIGQVTHRPVLTDDNGNPRKRNGQKQYGPEQVVFSDGEPLVRAEPLVPPADFYAVREILEGRRSENRQSRRHTESALLTGVIHCGRCGQRMWRLSRASRHRKDRYRCGSTQQGAACGNGTVAVEDADAYITAALFNILGNLPHTRQEYITGTDHTATLAEIDAQLMSYSEAVGRFPAGSPSFDTMMEKVDTLTAKREELAAQPDTDSGYRYVPTGETFGEHWDSLSSAGKNDFLRDHGVRLDYVNEPGGTEPEWNLDPGDIPAMVEAVSPGQVEAVREKLAALELPTDDPALILATVERDENVPTLRTDSGKPRHAGWQD